MATYLLFAGSNYYPAGGMYDLIGAYASEQEAREAFVPDDHDWAHIAEVGPGIVARKIASYRPEGYAEWRSDGTYSEAFPLGKPIPIGPLVLGGWVTDGE
jgi:hypothetical protein